MTDCYVEIRHGKLRKGQTFRSMSEPVWRWWGCHRAAMPSVKRVWITVDMITDQWTLWGACPGSRPVLEGSQLQD